jgi:hypothetical protein
MKGIMRAWQVLSACLLTECLVIAGMDLAAGSIAWLYALGGAGFALWLVISRTRAIRMLEVRQDAEREEADARSASWHAEQREKERSRRIREVKASLKELRELDHAYGDAGTVAFILGIPVEDVLRVTGEHDMKEIDDEIRGDSARGD